MRWKKAALENCPFVPCIDIVTPPAPSFTCGTSTIFDIDGNSYNKVQIGTQCWTKENLKVTKYNNGDLIPIDNSGGLNIHSLSASWGRTTGVRAIYGNLESNLSTYGFLYNWYAITDGRKICPSGWHIPTLSDVNLLKSTLNNVALNESGFNANLGGFRYESGNYDGLGGVGFYWISEANGSNVWMFFITSSDNQLGIGDNSPMKGMSVRCLKD